MVKAMENTLTNSTLCKHCGEVRPEKELILGLKMPEPCHCDGYIKAAKEEEAAIEEEQRMERFRRIRALTDRSGMGERSIWQTFETFDENENNKGLKKGAMIYAEMFEHHLPKRGMPPPKRNGILICGNIGTGKTHITSAIANELLGREIRVICMTERKMLAAIRHTFSDNSGMTEKDVIERYINVPLLIIDDIGKEKATDWSLATLYSIIDGRYEKAMPLVITSNYTPDELIKRLTPHGADETTAECITDRLNEMCHVATTKGESWRSK